MDVVEVVLDLPDGADAAAGAVAVAREAVLRDNDVALLWPVVNLLERGERSGGEDPGTGCQRSGWPLTAGSVWSLIRLSWSPAKRMRRFSGFGLGGAVMSLDGGLKLRRRQAFSLRDVLIFAGSSATRASSPIRRSATSTAALSGRSRSRRRL